MHDLGNRTFMTPEQQEQASILAREVAFSEAKISKILNLVSTVLDDTKGKVERKQAQTLEELQVA